MKLPRTGPSITSESNTVPIILDNIHSERSSMAISSLPLPLKDDDYMVRQAVKQ